MNPAFATQQQVPRIQGSSGAVLFRFCSAKNEERHSQRDWNITVSAVGNKTVCLGKIQQVSTSGLFGDVSWCFQTRVGLVLPRTISYPHDLQSVRHDPRPSNPAANALVAPHVLPEDKSATAAETVGWSGGYPEIPENPPTNQGRLSGAEVLLEASKNTAVGGTRWSQLVWNLQPGSIQNHQNHHPSLWMNIHTAK